MEARWSKDVDGEEEETEVSHSLGVHEEKFKQLERALIEQEEEGRK